MSLFISELLNSMHFVSHANMFWGCMGFTTSIAMFVGAMLYNGNLGDFNKGLYSVGSYATMLIWTNTARILPQLFYDKHFVHDGRAMAGIATVIYLTIFWILGNLLGVIIFKYNYGHKKRS